jgi:hypothetical protein
MILAAGPGPAGDRGPRLVPLIPGAPGGELAYTGTVESALVSGEQVYVLTLESAALGAPRPRTLRAFSLPGCRKEWAHPVELAPPPQPRPKRPG